MKRNFVLLSAAILALFMVGGSLQADNSPIGVWKNIDDETNEAKSHIQIFKGKDGKIYGKIIKLLTDEPDSKCDECKGELYNKPVVGMTIIYGLTYDKKSGEYTGGQILDPGNGKFYKCYIKVLDGGKKLKVRGYIGFAALGRTQYWYRLQ